MKYLFCSIYMCLVLFQATAQRNVVIPQTLDQILFKIEWNNQQDALAEELKPRDIKNRYSKYEGSAFLTSDIKGGSVRLNNDELIENLSLIFDMKSKDLFLSDNDVYNIINKVFIKEIIFKSDGKEIIFKKVNPVEKDWFSQILFEDNELVLFKETRISFSEGQDNGIVQIKPKLLKSEKYFITNKTKRKTVNGLNLRKKNIFDYISKDRQERCRKFIKEQKRFKLKSVESYVQMLSATTIHL